MLGGFLEELSRKLDEALKKIPAVSPPILAFGFSRNLRPESKRIQDTLSLRQADQCSKDDTGHKNCDRDVSFRYSPPLTVNRRQPSALAIHENLLTPRLRVRLGVLQTVLIPDCLGVTAWLAVVGQQGRPCWFQGRNGVDQLHGLLAVGTVSDWVVVHGARHGLAY
jgi:hypothetical protein